MLHQAQTTTAQTTIAQTDADTTAQHTPASSKLKPRGLGWMSALLLLVALLALTVFTDQDKSVQASERAVNSNGIIAYVTENHEIWVVNADGSQARKLWEIPQDQRAYMTSGIQDLAWRKDGSMLAFVSGHEPQCSVYETNVYVIDADGSNFQRVTNRPACSETKEIATGSVTVSLRNQFTTSQIAEVSVEGLTEPVFVSLLPSQVKQITIPNVPDLGANIMQAVVAVEGSRRWIIPGADVIAGQTVDAGELAFTTAARLSSFKVWDVSWSPDGQSLAFLLGSGIMQQVPLQGGVLQRSSNLLAGDAQAIQAANLSWSPVDNTVIYTAFDLESGTAVYRATVDSDQVAERLVNVDDTRGLAWLPDGSGFVMANFLKEFFTPVNGNLFYIDLANEMIYQLTNFDSEYAFSPSVSPDGKEVIFHYAPNLEPTSSATLRIIPLGGGEATQFGPSDIAHPAWGVGSVSTPPMATSTPTPTATATSQPGATATATPTATVSPQPEGSDHTVYLPYTTR